jgi:predicted metal-dependent HD superfamily phosphohydrolase
MNDAAGGGTREQLLARWSALLLRTRDGTPGPDPRPYGENLLDRWSAPHRRYHSTDHLHAVLDRVEELAPHVRTGGGTTELDLAAVLLAAWFHDAVHRPWHSENEERSARLAERALPEAGVPEARTREVARLVRLTADHDPEPGDTDGEVLCDADLAVLAGSPEAYAAYAADVRAEYDFVPEPDFREGRAAVLRQLLGHERLFSTPYAYERWEEPARRNLGTELELLSRGGAGAPGGTGGTGAPERPGAPGKRGEPS